MEFTDQSQTRDIFPAGYGVSVAGSPYVNSPWNTETKAVSLVGIVLHLDDLSGILL